MAAMNFFQMHSGAGMRRRTAPLHVKVYAHPGFVYAARHHPLKIYMPVLVA